MRMGFQIERERELRRFVEAVAAGRQACRPAA